MDSVFVLLTDTHTAATAPPATLPISDDPPGSPPSLSQSCPGLLPPVSFPTTTLFRSAQRLSTTSPAQTVTLTNSGTATLSITSIALAGSNPGDFAIAA